MSDELDVHMQRALTSLDGLAMGDAFGERFFGDPHRVAQAIADRSVPPAPWFWTDDTEMALSIVEILHRHRGIDRDALARSFAERHARDPSRGYGAGAYRLLTEIRLGRDWQTASRALFSGMGSFGNGAAMRVGPLGAYFAHDLDAVVEHARASAEVAHAHPEGQAGAIATALAAAYSARRSSADGDLLEFVLARTPAGETLETIERAARLPESATVQLAANVLGTGARVSAMDTVPFALWCARRHLDDFREAMWTTVSGLGDRDTTCAIVGSIVSLRTNTIPEEWRDAREPLEEDPVVMRARARR